MIRLYVFPLAFLAAVGFSAACRETEHGFDCSELDEFIAGVMECKKIPGMSVALVKDQDTVLTKGYGLADIDKGVPVGQETLFPIASMSKAFTATLWANLLPELTDVSTTTPLKDVLGSWFELPDDFRTEQLTMADAFCHRAGLNDYNLFLTGFGMDMERHEYVRRIRYGQALVPFRTNFVYSNQMFTLAGYVAEFLKATTWETLMQERILDALDMTSSTFCEHIIEREEGVAQPYVYNFSGGYYIPLDKEVLRVADLPSPAGAIVSNAVDMARWLKFQVARGKNEKGEQVVDTDLLVATYLPNNVFPSGPQTLPTFPVSDSMPTYASGWINEMYRGYPKVYHDGSLGGYNSGMSVFHTGNIGIFTAINGPHTADAINGMFRIHSYAADLLLGLEPWLNVSTACSYPAPWYPPAVSSEEVGGEQPSDESNTVLKMAARKSTKEGILGAGDRLSSIKRSNKVSHFEAGPRGGIPNIARDETPKRKGDQNVESQPRTSHGQSGDDGGSRAHIHGDTAFEAEKLIHATRERRVRSSLPLSDYTGMYGHLFLGNVTVFLDDQDGQLQYDYGLFGRGVLLPYLENVFLFTINTEMWYIYPPTGMFMEFFSSNENEPGDIDRVIFPTSYGALFERDLKLSDGKPTDK